MASGRDLRLLRLPCRAGAKLPGGLARVPRGSFKLFLHQVTKGRVSSPGVDHRAARGQRQRCPGKDHDHGHHPGVPRRGYGSTAITCTPSNVRSTRTTCSSTCGAGGSGPPGRRAERLLGQATPQMTGGDVTIHDTTVRASFADYQRRRPRLNRTSRRPLPSGVRLVITSCSNRRPRSADRGELSPSCHDVDPRRAIRGATSLQLRPCGA